MRAKKLFFMECHLAGRQYHDADEVWEDLRVGTKLQLVRDMDNRHDPEAVAVVYKKNDEEGEAEEFLLGYIPREDNEVIAHLLEMGWTDIFECRISRINPEAHYEQQVRLSIRIKRNERNNM